MTYFILQTLFWLLVAFIAGLILGRWMKRLFCKPDNQYQVYTEKASTMTNRDTGSSSYSGTADKLAFRDRGEQLDVETKDYSGSTATAAAATATAAIAGAASYALKDNDNEVDIDTPESTVDTNENKNIETDSQREGENSDDISAAASKESTDSDNIINADERMTEVSPKELSAADTDNSLDMGTVAAGAGAIPTLLDDDVEDDNGIKVGTESTESSNADDEGVAMRKARQAEIDREWDESVVDDIDEVTDTIKNEVEVKEGSTSSTVTGTVAAAALGAASGSTSVSSSDKVDISESSHSISGEETTRSPIAGLYATNLKIIEGIGPAMEKVLHENGVNTWQDVSMKTDIELRAILDRYDDKYKGVQIEGWVEQATLAAQGKVDELINWQKQGEGDNVSQLETWINRIKDIS